MASPACELISTENGRLLVDSIDTVLTDCDGVLWDGDDAIEGAVETIQTLKSMGKRVFYVTNNSTKTRKEYMAKCTKMGLPADEESIIGSAHVTALYMKNVMRYTGKVYCIGSPGLGQEFDKAGITHIGIGPDDFIVEDMREVATMPMDPEVKCVVVGYDKYFNYAKVTKASGYLQQPDCHFIGTNFDSGLPMGEARIIPGTGSLLRCVEVAAQRQAKVIGKPSPLMMEVAMEEHAIDPSRTMMIGDRCNTDIALAGNCGFKSLLVLTGFSTLEEVAKHRASGTEEGRRQVPDYYAPRLGQLGAVLNGTL